MTTTPTQKLTGASRTNCPGPYLQAPYLPQEVDQITYAFPADIGPLTPDPADIPDEFWPYVGGHTTWNNFAGAWFAGTLPKDVGFLLKEGIDGNLAIRHLATMLRSFQPKHEHKEAAVAHLASLWFHAVVLDDQALYGEIPADWPTTEIDDTEEEQA